MTFILCLLRTSSASEYSMYRDQHLQKHGSALSKDLIGPVVMGPIISIDDWKPERPPKNPSLRVPSPDLPPPPPTMHQQENDANSLNHSDSFPPPPVELMRSHIRQMSEPDTKFNSASRRNSFAGSTVSRAPFIRTTSFEQPPILPRKPTPADILNMPRSKPTQNEFVTAQLIHPSAQPLKAHKVIINGKNEINGNQTTRTSVRKRPHNGQISVIEMQSPRMHTTTNSTSPPLKPRLPIATIENGNRSTPTSNVRSSMR